MMLTRHFVTVSKYGRLLEQEAKSEMPISLANVMKRSIRLACSCDMSYNKKQFPTFVRSINTQVPRPYVDTRLSYSFGRSNDALRYTTIGRELVAAAKTRPDQVAFVFYSENKSITLKQLHDDVNMVVKSLLTKFNIRRGDYVGIFAYNCYHWALLQYACSRLGAIMTPINPSNKSDELAFVLEQGHIKCLFMPGPKSVQSSLNKHLEVINSDQIHSLAASNKLKLRDIVFIDSENDYSGTSLKLPNCKLHEWKELISDGVIFSNIHEAEQAGFRGQDSCIYDLDQVSPEDIFSIYYTSGTTGKPKGACVSHFTVFNNTLVCQRRLRNGRPLTWRKVSSLTLPMFHIFAGVLSTLAPILANSTIVYTGHSYDIKTFVNSIIDNDADTTSLTPTMLIDLLSYVKAHDLANKLPLKTIQSGGAALVPEVASRAMKLLPNLEEIRLGYGSTENGGVATLQTLHEPAETRHFTVGSPIDFCEVRVVKPKSEEVLPHGEKGEIQTRGYNTMVEYLDQQDKTAEVLPLNRWYRTGDLGFMYPHGSIQICGRLKHMIIKGGENIYPEEISQLIHKLDCVEDVHVVGVPDRRFGEQVCAWVKLKTNFREARVGEKNGQIGDDGKTAVTKESILKYCQDNITYFKVPRYLLFIDEYPMTPTKKVQNHVLVEMGCKILGIEQ